MLGSSAGALQQHLFGGLWCEDRPILPKLSEAWTLWDIMRAFNSSLFFRLARGLEHLSALNAKQPINQARITDDEEVSGLKDLLDDIRAPLCEIDLRTTILLLDRISDSLDSGQLKHIDLSYSLRGLAMLIEEELKGTIVLQIPLGRSKYYGEKQLFGSVVSEKFPSVSDDLEEAANCMAVARYTAAVFHVMRVLEVGLQSLASKLSISLAKDRNWQDILNDVKGAINKLPCSTRDEKDFHAKCSAAHAHLQCVKDAWRNNVMHPRAFSYSEQQAIDVIENSRALMVKIAEIV